MSLGKSLYDARKKSGLSQEAVAEKLGISRQTVSKWELDETVPDIMQAKKLSNIYNITLDELIKFDIDVKKLEDTIKNTSEEVQNKVDWTKLWASKYPILEKYKSEVQTEEYMSTLKVLLDKLKKDYNYNDLDAFLVLKDILAYLWNNKKA